MRTRGILVALLTMGTVACAAEPELEEEAGGDALTVSALAECASPLMRAIYDSAKQDVRKGNVPSSYFATSFNRANPQPLITGPEIFPAMRRLIESAEQEVVMQFYVFDTDCDAAREIFSALRGLEQRRREAGATSPVSVRVVFSVLGLGGVNTNKPADIAREVEALGLDPAYVTFDLAMYVHNALGNLHSKAVVVDQRRAIVTGANVQHQHDYEAPWHDLAFELEGHVAEGLAAEFDDAWSESKRWTCGSQARDFLDCNEKTKPFVHAPAKDSLPDTCTPMLITTRPGDGWPFANGIDNTQDRAFLAVVANATSTIRIHTPNLNDDHLKKAMVEALVKKPELVIDVVLSKGFNDGAMNIPSLGGTNEENADWLYDKLREKGVDDACNRLRLRWYSHDGATAVDGKDRASHAKYMAADGQIAIVGSANMDGIAWNHSRELNVVVDDPATVQAWNASMFDVSFSRAIVPDRCKDSTAASTP